MDLQAHAHELVKATDYRSFLAKAFTISSRGSRPLTYAELARRAGFSARSFPADVIGRHRRITPRSLPQFVRGFRLRGDLKNYFSLLVAKEEPDLNPNQISMKDLELQLVKIRERVLHKNSLPATKEKSHSRGFYGDKNALEIYAALGTTDGGATVSEIANRTRLEPSACRRSLGALLDAEVIRRDPANTERFFPLQAHILFERLGEENFFQEHYLKMLGEFRTRSSAKSEFAKEDRLFFTSVFSIRQDRARSFKKQLRELITQFVDTAEDPGGDSVAKILIGFVPD